jgi:transketolase
MAAAAKPWSGRQASQEAVVRLAPHLPELIGGSADLSVSTMAVWPAAKPVSAEGGGNFVCYGVREFGMAAIMNGMLCHGGFRPFAGTYLVFSDYARNALRMAALMGLGAIYVLTHDSIGRPISRPSIWPRCG